MRYHDQRSSRECSETLRIPPPPQVYPKPVNQSECLDELSYLLTTRFADMSGIIYTTSVKDCDELAEELRQRDLKVASYHASLDADKRSQVHQLWLANEYQAVVATIAFGMGIDKPDVRFVIHHSISKSMENFYQVSALQQYEYSLFDYANFIRSCCCTGKWSCWSR